MADFYYNSLGDITLATLISSLIGQAQITTSAIVENSIDTQALVDAISEGNLDTKRLVLGVSAMIDEDLTGVDASGLD